MEWRYLLLFHDRLFCYFADLSYPKFTAIGTVYLRADLFAENEQTYTVRFTVVDSGRSPIQFQKNYLFYFIFNMLREGIGIKPGDSHKLFQSFQQIDSDYKTRKYDGTGVGT